MPNTAGYPGTLDHTARPSEYLIQQSRACSKESLSTHIVHYPNSILLCPIPPPIETTGRITPVPPLVLPHSGFQGFALPATHQSGSRYVQTKSERGEGRKARTVGATPSISPFLFVQAPRWDGPRLRHIPKQARLEINADRSEMADARARGG